MLYEVITTDAAAWQALARHRAAWSDRPLRELFAADPRRFERFSLELGDLLFDYSKHLVDAETVSLLCALARESYNFI